MGWLSDVVDDIGDFFSGPVGQAVSVVAAPFTGGASLALLGLGAGKSGPKLPDMPALGTDPALAAERKAQKQDEDRRRAIAGKPSTVLTGYGGLLDEPSLSSRTLLGL